MDLIKSIWNGELPLVKVYWIYGALVGVLLKGVVQLSYYFVPLNYIQPYSYCLIALIIPYQFLISVGIWRSASTFTGNRVWAVLAKFGSIAGVIVAVNAGVQTINGDINNIYELEETAAVINKTLPSKIDNDTTLDKVDTVGNSFNLHYTLVNYSNSKELVELVQKVLGTSLIKNACTTKELKQLIDKNIPINYIYADKSGVEVTRFVVDKAQCLK